MLIRQVFRYREKPLQERLDLILQRNLYVLAIQIAQKAGVTTSQQNSIFRKYGDYLYQKKDYDTAMQQYLRAIDSAEPSHIIRKARYNNIRTTAPITNGGHSFLVHNESTTLSTILKSFMKQAAPTRITLCSS